jgi:hypothetical protein
MSGERLEVSVTFEPAKGYVATVPDEPTIAALSLVMLRHSGAQGRTKWEGIAGCSVRSAPW